MPLPGWRAFCTGNQLGDEEGEDGDEPEQGVKESLNVALGDIGRCPPVQGHIFEEDARMGGEDQDTHLGVHGPETGQHFPTVYLGHLEV